MISSKDPGSTEFFKFKYASDPRMEGDTVLSATCTIEQLLGPPDDSLSEMLIGPVRIVANSVYQMVTLGEKGCTYGLKCWALTTLGQKLDGYIQFEVAIDRDAYTP